MNICNTAHKSQADVPCRVLLTRSDKGLMLVEVLDLDRGKLLSLRVRPLRGGLCLATLAFICVSIFFGLLTYAMLAA